MSNNQAGSARYDSSYYFVFVFSYFFREREDSFE